MPAKQQSNSIQTIESDGKQLLVVAVNLTSDRVPSLPIKEIQALWKKVAPHSKLRRHVAFIRDSIDLTIENRYPGGYAPNQHEVQVAVPKWPVDTLQLIDTLAHELHHLIRWQQGGYGKTLGEMLATEGVACLFAEKESGWRAPWTKGSIPDDTWGRIKTSWDSDNIEHAEWFFEGPLGKWLGYKAGYALCKQKLGNEFSLAESFTLTEQDIRPN